MLKILKKSRLYIFLSICYHELKCSITGKEIVIAACYGARTYFRKNKDKIKAVESYLQDEESKKTYLNIIEYRKKFFFRRLFLKKEDAPVYHKFENQYFINDFFKYGENEILVDCGAYTGDSIEVFSKVVPNFSKVIAFEPDPYNFKQLQENYKDNEKIFLINAGAWNKNDSLRFSALKESGCSSNLSKSNREKTISVSVLALDMQDDIRKSKITFIKMDVEGAELEALKGAEETIKKNKPRLAICLYHYNRHFVEIPEYIRSIVPDYKFWVRHHSKEYPYETVLYAGF